jgi:hypothetical protein
MAKIPDSNARAALVDQLAAIEHERWAHWQRYMHGQASRRDDGTLILPADLVARWEKQIDTRYADLSADEQESDKEQVERYLPIIEEAFLQGEARDGD